MGITSRSFNVSFTVAPPPYGTINNPFQIWNPDDLRRVGTGQTFNGNVWSLSAHYRLMQNVTLPVVGAGQSNWTAIGSDANPFTGNFDGQGHTIANLTINSSANDQGMFGVIRGGTVRDLRLVGGSISGGFDVGGVAGRIVNAGEIRNVSTTGNVSGNNGVGGVAGSLRGPGVGTAVTSTVRNSSSTGNVSGGGNVGGVVGRVDTGSEIVNSFATGNVTGDYFVGGIAGLVNSRITNSFATGNVTGNSYVGGIGGQMFGVTGLLTIGNITNSVALNNTITRTTGSTPVFVGRVAGDASGDFTLSNNHANSGMAIIGYSFPANEFHTAGRNGADVTLATTRTQAWWQNTASFSFGTTDNAPWQWCTVNQHPRLHWEN
jgi:hypothetical protein